MTLKSGAIWQSIHLYTIIIYTDGVMVDMCPCRLLAIAGVIDILAIYAFTVVHICIYKYI